MIKLVRAGGRLFRITVTAEPVGLIIDCRDSVTTFESQALIWEETEMPFAEIIKDSMVRDAIRSAYLNATAHESGNYPTGGTRLPDGYEITVL